MVKQKIQSEVFVGTKQDYINNYARSRCFYKVVSLESAKIMSASGCSFCVATLKKAEELGLNVVMQYHDFGGSADAVAVTSEVVEQ